MFFHGQPSPSNSSQSPSKKTSAPFCKPCCLRRLLCPPPPPCSSFGCFSSRSTRGGGLRGFSSSPIPTKWLRTGLRDAADVERASTADLTAAVRRSGLRALPRDARRLRGLCCSAREVKDAVKEGRWCYFCPWKEGGGKHSDIFLPVPTAAGLAGSGSLMHPRERGNVPLQRRNRGARGLRGWRRRYISFIRGCK